VFGGGGHDSSRAFGGGGHNSSRAFGGGGHGSSRLFGGHQQLVIGKQIDICDMSLLICW